MMFRAFTCLVVVGFAGCLKPAQDLPTTPESVVRDKAKPMKIIDTATGETVELEAFYSALRTKRVVYVAERHDNAKDHGVQFSVLRAMHRADPTIAVGFEMFQTPFQPSLDAWTRGELDENALRRRTEYDDRWGFDYSLVRPLLEYTRAHRIAAVALNAPREITRAVAEAGLGSLREAERALLPELDLLNAEHRAMVVPFLQAHFEDGDSADAGAQLERLYTAQVIWDETMARSVADSLERGHAKTVAFAGRMHVARGLGIPSRAARRGATPFATVMPVDESELQEHVKTKSADYLWVHK